MHPRNFVAVLGALLACLFALPTPLRASSLAPTLTVVADRAAIRPDPSLTRGVRISVTPNEDAIVTVLVTPAGVDSVLTTLATDRPVTGGTTLSLTWFGLDDASNPLPDGKYVVGATAQTVDGPASGEVFVRVDTRAPTLDPGTVDPRTLRTTGSVRFSFTVSDPGSPGLPIRIGYAIADAAGRKVVRSALTDQDPGAGVATWDGRIPGHGLAPSGGYSVTLRAVDAAGNTEEARPLPFVVARPGRSVVVDSVPNTGNRVALTFDDCNDTGAWRSILDTLERTHTPATFFCVGYRVAAEPRLARRMVRMGIAIGNHSWDHPRLPGMSDAKIRAELVRTERAWWHVARTTPVPLFRPPYGARSAAVERVAGRLGYRWTAMWNFDPRDWTGISPSKVVRSVLSSLLPGGITVLHIHANSAAALPAIIAGLKARGRRPVTLPQLLAAGGLH